MRRNLEFRSFSAVEKRGTSAGDFQSSNLFTASKGALPYYDHSPALHRERPFDPFVSRTVARNLLSPEICSRRGNLCTVAIMTMPEAAMNEDGSSVLCQRNVRRAWKIFLVQCISESKRMEGSSEQHLGLGVAFANPTHVPTTLCPIAAIGHHRHLCVQGNENDRPAELGTRHQGCN